jgi:hypothetical protein
VAGVVLVLFAQMYRERTHLQDEQPGGKPPADAAPA